MFNAPLFTFLWKFIRPRVHCLLAPQNIPNMQYTIWCDNMKSHWTSLNPTQSISQIIHDLTAMLGFNRRDTMMLKWGAVSCLCIAMLVLWINNELFSKMVKISTHHRLTLKRYFHWDFLEVSVSTSACLPSHLSFWPTVRLETANLDQEMACSSSKCLSSLSLWHCLASW